MNILQIDWLQPIYTFMFSNGLIACLVFMGIGVLLDVGFVMARPFQSMILALFAELGTVATLPIAVAMGMTPKEAASVAMIGGADGPMVLFTSLILAKDLFVPITVVGYLYLGLTYGGYPYLIKLLIPKRLRGIPMPPEKQRAEDHLRPEAGVRGDRLHPALPAVPGGRAAVPVALPRRGGARKRTAEFPDAARRDRALRRDLLPRADAGHPVRGQHDPRSRWCSSCCCSASSP